MRKSLAEMFELSRQWWQNATQEEKDKMIEEQRKSWVRGEMGMGTDKDEAEYALALKNKDVEKLKELDRQAAERAAMVR